MSKQDIKIEMGDKKFFGVFSVLPLKKLVPGLVLFSIVFSGILAPVSVTKNNTDISVYQNKVLAESDNITKNPGGTFTYRGKIYGSYVEAASAREEGEGDDGSPEMGGTTFQSGLTPEKRAELNAASSQPTDDNPFSCNIITRFKNCIGSTIYYLFFVPATYILTLSGWLFDITMAFTLSANILDSTFAREGWVVTRDLANMFFIFILLYIAIATILDIAGYNAKALLAKLIVVALLLNFSLFATRVVIDASNILALAFYDSISAPARAGDIGNVSSLVKFFDVKPKGISAGLASFFNPQQLLATNPQGAKTIVDFVKDDIGKLIFIYLFSAAIILTAAWAFFSIAFLFITRTAILWFLMATAPIAFAAIILPKTRSLFDKWWGELISKSFCVAVFLFFLWLITQFVDKGIFKNISSPNGRGLAFGLDSSNNFLFVTIIILLQFSILIVLLIVAKQQTQKMCGAVAGFSMNFVNNLGTKAAGFLAGGVGGFALRNTLGGAAFSLAEAKKEKWGSGNVFARLALQGARKVSSAGFDIRATKLGGQAELGKAAGAGGYKAAIDKRVKEDVAWAKSFGEGKDADLAREKFVQRIEGQNMLSRLITGRGVLSKTEPEKAAKAIKKTLYAAEKTREEDTELKEMKNRVLEKQPAEVKDEKGNVVYAYKNMDEIEKAVKSSSLSLADSERIVKEATDAFAKSLSENLENTKVDLKGFEVSGNAEGAAGATRAIERLMKDIGSVEKMNKLEDRIENRNRRMVDKQERESSQKPSSGGGDKDKK